jgi:hypothetical protein
VRAARAPAPDNSGVGQRPTPFSVHLPHQASPAKCDTMTTLCWFLYSSEDFT